MRIAVLGTGNIGGGLGERFRAAGHDVVMGSRDPASGVLQKVEGYRDSYAHTEGVWLPSSRVVALIAGDPSPRVRMIRLSGHRKLSGDESGSR